MATRRPGEMRKRRKDTVRSRALESVLVPLFFSLQGQGGKVKPGKLT